VAKKTRATAPTAMPTIAPALSPARSVAVVVEEEGSWVDIVPPKTLASVSLMSELLASLALPLLLLLSTLAS
jgi:hypothetical protein